MLWIWMLACGSAPTESPTPSPAEPAPEPAEAPAPKGPSRISPELMAAITTGELKPADLFDPVRGLIVVEIAEDASGENPAAGDDGVVRVAERLCGSAATDKLQTLVADLSFRLEQAKLEASEAPTFVCKGATCTHEATMEVDGTGRYVFRSIRKGIVLGKVVRIGGHMSEAWTAEATAWSEARLEQMHGGRCGEPTPAAP